MKFEHLFENILFYFSWKLKFYAEFTEQFKNTQTINYLFIWKINNFSDNYWFCYSNKKLTFERRFLNV